MTLDMRTTVEPKSDQLNADDLIGRTLTIEITKVSGNDTPEQPVSIHFKDDHGKPYKPCKSMRRVLIHCWGHDAKNYVGRSMTLYSDPTVKFGGLEVGGIRISHMSHIDKAMVMALTASKANKKPFKVMPLAVTPTAQIDPELAVLQAAGDAASKKGSVAYIAWKDSLTAEQKPKIKPFHSAWASEAKRVDESAVPEMDDPLSQPPIEDEDLPL